MILFSYFLLAFLSTDFKECVFVSVLILYDQHESNTSHRECFSSMSFFLLRLFSHFLLFQKLLHQQWTFKSYLDFNFENIFLWDINIPCVVSAVCKRLYCVLHYFSFLLPQLNPTQFCALFVHSKLTRSVNCFSNFLFESI